MQISKANHDNTTMGWLVGWVVGEPKVMKEMRDFVAIFYRQNMLDFIYRLFLSTRKRVRQKS
jgi:hypothetical protein